MYNLLKKKRRDLKRYKDTPIVTKAEPAGSSAKGSYVRDDEDVSLKAADRKDRLDAETRAGRLGPFAGKESKGVAVGIAVIPKGGGIHPAGAEEGGKPAPKGGGGSMTLPPIGHEPDARGMADHHQKLADYFGKVAKPAGQTTPATTALSPYEKSELDDEINMSK